MKIFFPVFGIYPNNKRIKRTAGYRTGTHSGMPELDTIA
jgi:hypothetical protein